MRTRADRHGLLGLILAGGRSRRMGGHDKRTIELAGLTLIERVAAALAPQVDDLAIVANDPLPSNVPVRWPILPDPVPGRPGPLAGILAGLRRAQAVGCDTVLSSPCDVPFLPSNLAARLLSRRRAGDLVIVASSAGRLHPTIALWPIASLQTVASALQSGQQRMHDVIEEIGFEVAEFEKTDDGIDPFFNINTPADLASAEEVLAGPSGPAPQ